MNNCTEIQHYTTWN